MRTITVKRENHKGENRLMLYFEYDSEIIMFIKDLDGIRWSASCQCWHLPDRKGMIYSLMSILKGRAYIDYSSLRKEPESETERYHRRVSINGELDGCDMEKVNEFRLWMSHRRYSPATIRNYLVSFKNFLRFIKPKSFAEISEQDMMKYVNDYIIPNKLSYTFQNQAVSAVKLFFQHIMKNPLEIDKFEKPRSEHRLPNVLSKEEIIKILNAHRNLKHRAILSYG